MRGRRAPAPHTAEGEETDGGMRPTAGGGVHGVCGSVSDACFDKHMAQKAKIRVSQFSVIRVTSHIKHTPAKKVVS